MSLWSQTPPSEILKGWCWIKNPYNLCFIRIFTCGTAALGFWLRICPRWSSPRPEDPRNKEWDLLKCFSTFSQPDTPKFVFSRRPDRNGRRRGLSYGKNPYYSKPTQQYIHPSLLGLGQIQRILSLLTPRQIGSQFQIVSNSKIKKPRKFDVSREFLQNYLSIKYSGIIGIMEFNFFQSSIITFSISAGILAFLAQLQ